MDWTWLYAVFLLSVRLAPTLLTSPLLGAASVPVVVKTLLSFALSASLVSTFDLHVTVPNSNWLLLRQMLNELFLGALLAFGVQVAFGALAFAGRLLDAQMSLGLAGIINPLSQRANSLSGVMFELLAVAYFHAVNGFMLLLRSMAALLDLAPLGVSVTVASVHAAVGQFGVLILLSITLAAPLMVTLFAMDVGVALMSRSMPQINAFFIAMPAKVALGWLLMLLLIPRLGWFFERWFFSVVDYWAQLIG